MHDHRIQLEGADEIIEASLKRYAEVIRCLRSERWVRAFVRRPELLRDLFEQEEALDAALTRRRRHATQRGLSVDLERLEQLRASMWVEARGRIRHVRSNEAVALELSRVIAVTTSLSGTYPFPEWSALAWGTTDDTLWRANPYDAAEWVWLTVIAAFFMGTTGVIVAGISAGAQGPGTLLSSVFGALLAGWITSAFLEPLRVRIAAALRSWRLDLPATTGQRLVALGDFVLFESGGHCWKVQPDVTVVVRSRATKSGLWRFYLQEGGKVFSRLESDDADALEALLRALGFKVEA